MEREPRPISWVKAARKEFDRFPPGARERIVQALELASLGEAARIAKPMTGLGSGVWEIALAHRGDAYRAVYSLQLPGEIWVVHVFQKKSRTGIETPRAEIEVVRARLRRLRETYR